MSQPTTTQPRPPQVTAAAWMIMVGSVFVVLMVWDRIAGLHSLESQKALQDALDEPLLKGWGLEVSDLMTIIKTVSMVGASCATAMVILGYQTLRRSRSARVALTILAVPLFVCGLEAAGFVAAIVVAAVVTLWLGPARLWFDDAPDTRRSAHEPPLPRVPSPPQQTPPPQQWAQPSPWTHQPPAQQQPGGMPTWTPPPTSAYDVWSRLQARSAQRPAALVGASIVTWVVSALSLLILIGSIIVLASDSSSVLDSVHRQNPSLSEQAISDRMVLVLAFVTFGLFVVWAAAAIAVAIFCFLGRRWAWYALVVSSAVVAGLSAVGAIASLVLLLPLAAAITVIALLVRPEVRAWMR